jgi:3-deoxy-D-manno-octulosonate 8-phosphate phosphatase KdsC-like HAD superfamily phosphatase
MPHDVSLAAGPIRIGVLDQAPIPEGSTGSQALRNSLDLARLTDELGLKKEQVIACGDGANDLLMMAQAGLSVAFHAKPATRAKADVAINFGGLDSLLNLFD